MLFYQRDVVKYKMRKFYIQLHFEIINLKEKSNHQLNPCTYYRQIFGLWICSVLVRVTWTIPQIQI